MCSCDAKGLQRLGLAALLGVDANGGSIMPRGRRGGGRALLCDDQGSWYLGSVARQRGPSMWVARGIVSDRDGASRASAYLLVKISGQEEVLVKVGGRVVVDGQMVRGVLVLLCREAGSNR